MSSVPNPTVRPQGLPGPRRGSRRPAIGPQKSTEQVRQSLHAFLIKTSSFIKFLDAMVLLFSWLATWLGLWLVACLVDHWLLPLPSLGRWAFWSVGVASAAWWIVWQLVPLVAQRVNPVYAAKRIEHLVPEFKNGLVSWLELESMPNHGVPRGVMSQLTHRAAHFLGDQDPSTTIDTSPLIKLIGGVLLLVTSLAVHTMLSPKSVIVTGQRILFPWSSITPPSRVHILNVKPGAIELTQGKPLEVDVELKGLRRDEAVTVRFSTLDGQLTNRRIELSASTEGFRYVGNVTTTSTGVENELDYWVEAGDAVSGPYRVEISPLPSVVLKSVELNYPAYTGLSPRIVPGDKVEAVEGTKARILAMANQALSRGRLEINPDVGADGELIRAAAFSAMTIEDRKLQAEWLMQLNAEKENPTKLQYRIRGFNERGDANPRPILHSMSVLADVAPEISLVGPENRLLRVRENAQVNLEIRASDPDFGLNSIELEFSRNGIPGRGVTLLEADGVRGRQVKTFRIDLANWKAKVGDRFQIRATAKDNRHDPVSGQLAANSAESQPLLLQVVGPDESADLENSASPEQPTNPQDQGNPNDPQPDSNDGNQASNNKPQTPGEASNNPGKANPSENGSSEPSDQSRGEQSAGDQSANDQAAGENSEQQGSGQQGSGQQGSGQQGSGTAGQDNSAGQDASGQAGSQGSGTASQSGSSQQSPSSSGGSSGQSGNSQSDSQASERGGNSSTSGQSGNSRSAQSGNSAAGSENSPNSRSTDSSPGNSGGSQSANGGSSSGNGQPQNDGEVFERVREHMQGQSDESTANSSANGQSSERQSASAQTEGGQSASGQSADDPSGNSPQNSGASSPNGKSPANQESRGGSGARPRDSQPTSDDLKDGSGAAESSANQEPSPNPEANSGKSTPPKTQNDNSGDSQSASGQPNSAQTGTPSNENAAGGNSQNENSNSQSGHGNSNSQNSQSGNSQSGNSQSGNSQSGNSQSGNSQSGNSQSGNSQSGNSQSGNSQSGNSSSGEGTQPSAGSDSQNSASAQDASDGNSPSSGSSDQGSSDQGGSQPDASSRSQSGSSASGQSESSSADAAPSTSGSSAEQSGSQDSSSSGSAGQQSPTDNASQDQNSSPSGAGSGAPQPDPKSNSVSGESENPSDALQNASQNDSAADSSAGGSPSASGASSQPSSSAGSSSPNGPRGNSTGGGMTSGQPTGGGSGSEGGEGGGSGEPADVDRNYAEQTTQMVLDYLSRQKDQPDPQLLEELDWTARDLNQFVDRWNNARDLSESGSERDRLKWQEMLESLDLSGSGNRVRQGSGVNDAFQQMQDSGSRMQFPESLRKRFEAYNKALDRGGR